MESDLGSTDATMLHDLFDRTASRHPDRVALDIPPGASRPTRVRMTYAELQQRSWDIAGQLRSVAGADAVIAILLPRASADLYAAQLAVLRTGSAFTCLDLAFPDEHLAQVMTDIGAVALVTDDAGRRRCEGAGIAVPAIVNPAKRAAPGGRQWSTSSKPSDLAYVIYTSGTTGRPKGVLIEHASAVRLILGDVDYFGLTEDARVAQCSSAAYDSSIEESWLAFSVGAALVLLDDETVRLGPDLVPWLARERISVLCPTPTLLRTTGCLDPQRALPDLQLLYVGGEALPADLMNLWAAGRRMVNGYGPTECTVTVVRGQVRPGDEVGIGRPVPGSRAHVLGDDLEPVPLGEPGELCIAGDSLARGYHDREELTRDRFPIHPRLGRLYRTGDLVRLDAKGDLQHLGRIDAQVKLRGYRIELGAVEAVLSSCPGVRSVACTVQGDGGEQLLAAHIVPDDPHNPPEFEGLKDRLRKVVPRYMIPARFAVCDALPTTVGGKLDRKALAPIASVDRASGREVERPRNVVEARIADAFRRALRMSGEISIHDDFFADLGGDSLGAVEVICDLRASGAMACSRAVVRDLYEARTVARLAALPWRAEARGESSRLAAKRPVGRPVLSTLVQSLWLMAELVIGSAAAYGSALVTAALLGRPGGLALTVMFGAIALVSYIPISIAVAVLLKRILIGRYKAGAAPIWGGLFTRHWIVTSAARLIPWALLEGTPFAAMALRALGARVGRRLHVHRGVNLSRGGWDLLTIGDDVTLAQGVALRMVDFADGQLVLGAVSLGDGATVHVRGGLDPNTAIGRDGTLAALSCLKSGSTIPDGELWDGVPAEPAGRTPPPPIPTRGRGRPPLLHGILMVSGGLTGSFAILLAPGIFALAGWLFDPEAATRAAAWLEAPRLTAGGIGAILLLSATSLVLSLAALGIAVRLMGKVRPGVVDQYSLEAIAIWSKTRITESAGRWLSGSMFWPWWLRLAGMKVGKGCEISTIIDVLPETVSIGRESFFADGVYFCGPVRTHGTITVADTSLGQGTFLGNHALVPPGHAWPDGLFVGVSTVADPRLARPQTAWFGHPPMELPRRDVLAADRRLTHNPSLPRLLTRLFWELLRFSLPAVPIFAGCAWWLGMHLASPHFGFAGRAFLVAPLLTALSGTAVCLGVVALKWVLLGQMRPGHHVFWSCWCGRWDLLFMTWSLLARPWLGLLEGTLILNAYLRLTGMKIGRRVHITGFSQVVDPDMLSLGDDATVSCHVQAHSFEDRILKLDYIRVGPGATVGDNALLFYGAEIGLRTLVEAHSVVMKRDRLTPGERYEGCPSRPATA